MEKKITDHDCDKYVTTPEFNMLTAEDVAVRLKQKEFSKQKCYY